MKENKSFLLNTSYQDTQLLIGNDEKGDIFSIYRDIDYIFYAKNEDKAISVVSFIEENHYGDASFEKVNGKYRIMVTINMPSTQNIVCSISGLMACIAILFSIEYDGWGCVLQTA